MKNRIIVFVDHEIGYRLLEKIVTSKAGSELELVAAVTTLDNGKSWWPGIEYLCTHHKIPVHRYTEPFATTLDYTEIDWYLLLSWKHIMPPILISHPKRGVINLHYSLLPEYRGVYPVNWAIIEGKNKTGVTYHLVNEKIDSGPIICQRETRIFLSDTARTLQLRLDDLAFDLFDELTKYLTKSQHHGSHPGTANDYTLSYKSRADFIASNELNLNLEYRGIDLFNMLRGKQFLSDSRNIYVVDPASGKKIYISINLEVDKSG